MNARERAFSGNIPRPDDPKPQSRGRQNPGVFLGTETKKVRFWVRNNKGRKITSETKDELKRLKRVAADTKDYNNAPTLDESGDGITATLTYPKKSEWNYHQMARVMKRDFGEPTSQSDR